MSETDEVCLEQAEESGVWKCSKCGEEFHVSPIGPRKPLETFQKHVREKHAGATIMRPAYRSKRGS